MAANPKNRSQTIPEFPHDCFVSYSYRDSHKLRTLQKNAPECMDLVVFPEAPASEEFPVSNEIVQSIADCDGLVYLEGGHSEESDWVRFEKDFASRLGHRIFACSRGKLREVSIQPVDLNIQAIVSPEFMAKAERLLQWMKEERNFEIHLNVIGRRMKEVPLLMGEIRFQQAIALWLLDERTAATLNIADSELDEEYMKEVFVDDLDETGELPPDVPFIRARIDPNWFPYGSRDPEVDIIARQTFPHTSEYLDLVPSATDADFNWKHVDDLIILLTSETIAYEQAEACINDD